MRTLNQLEDRKPPEGRPGTLSGLIAAYRASPEFAALAVRTRADYQRVFDYLKPLGPAPLIEIDSGYLYAVRDKAASARKRRFANYTIQVLRLLFNWGMRRSHCEKNPALAVDVVKRPRNAPVVNRPWKQTELEIVLAEAPPELRVAVALGAFVGLREADAVTVTWACYDGAEFEVRQGKTGEIIAVKAHARLREILDAIPRVSPVIVIGARGRPFTQSGFQRRFFGLIRRLTDEGKVQPGLSFHGLRHTLGTLLAEDGNDPRTIAAVLGQRTTAMADHYSRTAERRHLAAAAITRLERKQDVFGKPAEKFGKP
jgi:integrase